MTTAKKKPHSRANGKTTQPPMPALPELSAAEKDSLRNMSDKLPQLSLVDLEAIRKTLLLASEKTSVGVTEIGRVLGKSDAYADLLLRSLCAANLMFINSGTCSLDTALTKPIGRHIARIELMIEQQAPNGQD